VTATATTEATRRDIVLLGSTGSIGTQTLDIVRANPDRFRVVALAAGGSDPSQLARQAVELEVPVVAVSRSTAIEDLQLALYAEAQKRGYHHGDFKLPRIIGGPDAPEQCAGLSCDIVLNAIDGAAGLKATLVALQAGVTLALANKESLIIGGDLVTSLAKPGQIVPVDSEHSALAQCLRGGRAEEVRRLVITASGGPFRGRSRQDLADVTPAEALAHPTWAMGPLVTINSSTLVNKGLEVIEAHLLFGLGFDRIEVVVHPQSIVHSMIEFHDGSTIAQASPPDMRLPIALALGWPDRVPDAAAAVDWAQAQSWEFEPVDHEAFPGLGLAVEAGQRAGLAPAIYNAANEVCVTAFLEERLSYLGIVDTVAAVLGCDDVPSYEGRLGVDGTVDEGLHAVLAADAWARERASALIADRTAPSQPNQPNQPTAGGDSRR
jgi:1-deoxy-D-xylulose-5-phosphate reductoisomerase